MCYYFVSGKIFVDKFTLGWITEFYLNYDIPVSQNFRVGYCVSYILVYSSCLFLHTVIAGNPYRNDDADGDDVDIIIIIFFIKFYVKLLLKYGIYVNLSNVIWKLVISP
jgi:hypothetical protein